MKLYIRDLIIETTRRCNLECEHCLRGDARNQDMDEVYLRELLHHVDSIGTVTFTGGEPFLHPQTIFSFIRICEELDVYVSDFYIATNGLLFEPRNKDTKLCKTSLLAIISLYAFCQENEISSVDISNDQFHWPRVTEENLLYAFSFTGKKGDFSYEQCIPEGHAEYFPTDRGKPGNVLDEEDPQVYLNCDGKILWNCDLSYETQDKEGITIKQAVEILQKAEETV